MATSDSHQMGVSGRRFAAAAGIEVPDDRIEVFAASLARNHELTRPVVEIDYGSIEPAPRFRAPRAQA